MKIAIDAMGGDYAPSVVIEGVSLALKEFADFEAILVGHEAQIAPFVKEFGLDNNSRVTIVHAEEVVNMDEPSTVALRKKKNSSITVAATLLAKNEADAIVSAGHTGASVAATKVKVRTMPGIDRPAIATIMPAVDGRFVLVDVGATPDCKPENFAQFAIMGEAYAQLILGVDKPKIGLLSVGEEAGKGNDVSKKAFELLSNMPINFVGNVEGSDLFSCSNVDVVVCDGFVGNVVLKSSEKLAKSIFSFMKTAIYKSPVRQLGGKLAKGAFKELKALTDKDEYGGAPLLGLNGPCIIGHGSSTPKAVFNAVRVAREFVLSGINEKISTKITESNIIIDS